MGKTDKIFRLSRKKKTRLQNNLSQFYAFYSISWKICILVGNWTDLLVMVSNRPVKPHKAKWQLLRCCRKNVTTETRHTFVASRGKNRSKASSQLINENMSLYADDPLQTFCPCRQTTNQVKHRTGNWQNICFDPCGWLVADSFWFDVLGKIKTVKRGWFSNTVIQKWGS